jgi:hypothetical protein
MADRDRDERVSERYRALGREEPRRALDETILAAARRRRLRWAVPVSIAAVVVLAVGVTLRVQLEQPRQAEEVALAPKVMEAPAPAPRAAALESRAPAAAAPPIAARKLEAPAGAAADRAEPAGRASAGVAVGKISAPPETPEQWLERIGKLRDAGKAREADESLAEFRKRYPDYRMSAAMRARVAPR